MHTFFVHCSGVVFLFFTPHEIPAVITEGAVRAVGFFGLTDFPAVSYQEIIDLAPPFFREKRHEIFFGFDGIRVFRKAEFF